MRFEHSNPKRAGFVGSIVVSGCMSGVLLATFVGHIVKIPSLPEYSWRIAFLFGFILSLIGFFIRQNLKETTTFTSYKIKEVAQNRLSFLSAMKKYWLECVATFFIASTSGVNIYFLSVYLPGYIKDILSIEIGYLNSIAILIIAILIPIFGLASDKFGRLKVLISGNLLLMLYPVVLFSLGYFRPNFSTLAVIMVTYAVIFSIYCGAMNTFLTEIFPAHNRYTCSAFSYSMGMALIGGTTPMVASLIKEYSNNYGLYINCYTFCVLLCSILSITALKIKINKTK